MKWFSAHCYLELLCVQTRKWKKMSIKTSNEGSIMITLPPVRLCDAEALIRSAPPGYCFSSVIDCSGSGLCYLRWYVFNSTQHVAFRCESHRVRHCVLGRQGCFHRIACSQWCELWLLLPDVSHTLIKKKTSRHHQIIIVALWKPCRASQLSGDLFQLDSVFFCDPDVKTLIFLFNTRA